MRCLGTSRTIKSHSGGGDDAVAGSGAVAGCCGVSRHTYEYLTAPVRGTGTSDLVAAHGACRRCGRASPIGERHPESQTNPPTALRLMGTMDASPNCDICPRAYRRSRRCSCDSLQRMRRYDGAQGREGAQRPLHWTGNRRTDLEHTTEEAPESRRANGKRSSLDRTGPRPVASRQRACSWPPVTP